MMDKMKAAALVPRKFRSVREKNGSHRRNKSSEPGAKTRPLTSESWLSIFRPESAKQAQREKEEVERESSKIEVITKRLQELNYHDISDEHVRYALNSKFAAGDIEKAVELLQIQQKAFAGIIQPYNPNVQMLGAENRGNVTCYLDALLFAMFAKMSAFECMLKNDLTDESQRKLAALLRLWVNMLRSGKLVYTDMTQHIQESLADCGWKDALLLEQQDTSEAFAFITETLQLPLLALQVDLFHQGKRDADDHKVVHERLLNLAVPPDPEGKGLKLEDCLEEYFNNKVDVLRDSFEEKKGHEKMAMMPTNTIRLVTTEEEGGAETSESAEHAENPPLQRRWTAQEPIVQSPDSMTAPESAQSVEPRPANRHRSTSIIQRIVVNSDEKSSDGDNESLLQRAKRTGSTVVKAVTIPAWQFFRLAPWHATSNSASEPRSDVEVARHFNQRPVVGICLKRYTMTERGVPMRQNTLIDIPDSLRLPHFMVVDDNNKAEQESNGLSQEYKLVLQSVICHRGDSLHSGHYIAFSRVAPKLLTDNRRHDDDPPPDYEEAQWAKFDDLAVENRVSYVDDIKQSLREEMPYLLFYQIVPMVDVTAASTDGSVTEPPSYHELAAADNNNVSGISPISEVVAAVEERRRSDGGEISRSTSGYFDSASATLVQATNGSGGPSIRFSAEIDDRPSITRLSFDEDPYNTTTEGGGRLKAGDSSRRGSVTFSESTAATTSTTPAVTPGERPSSPAAVTPTDRDSDNSAVARISRAAAKLTGKTTGGSTSKSRPTSQAGEGRISTTMSRRLGFSRGPSKEPLNGNLNATTTNGTNGTESAIEDAVIIAEEGDEVIINKEKEGHHHFHHNHNKKDRNKSKSRSSEHKEDNKKGKGKSKDSSNNNSANEPDRECAVM